MLQLLLPRLRWFWVLPLPLQDLPAPQEESPADKSLVEEPQYTEEEWRAWAEAEVLKAAAQVSPARMVVHEDTALAAIVIHDEDVVSEGDSQEIVV